MARTIQRAIQRHTYTSSRCPSPRHGAAPGTPAQPWRVSGDPTATSNGKRHRRERHGASGAAQCQGTRRWLTSPHWPVASSQGPGAVVQHHLRMQVGFGQPEYGVPRLLEFVRLSAFVFGRAWVWCCWWLRPSQRAGVRTVLPPCTVEPSANAPLAMERARRDSCERLELHLGSTCMSCTLRKSPSLSHGDMRRPSARRNPGRPISAAHACRSMPCTVSIPIGACRVRRVGTCAWGKPSFLRLVVADLKASTVHRRAAWARSGYYRDKMYTGIIMGRRHLTARFARISTALLPFRFEWQMLLLRTQMQVICQFLARVRKRIQTRARALLEIFSHVFGVGACTFHEPFEDEPLLLPELPVPRGDLKGVPVRNDHLRHRR